MTRRLAELRRAAKRCHDRVPTGEVYQAAEVRTYQDAQLVTLVEEYDLTLREDV